MGYQSMCGGPEESIPELPAPSSTLESEILTKDMNNPIEMVKSEDYVLNLLELAANNDIEGFKQSICNTAAIDETGPWYIRLGASKKMTLQRRTPLMIAATYGSVAVVKLILSLSEADVNCSCSPDKSTALHCAASGGSPNAVVVVKLLLLAGADPNFTDVYGHRAFDVIVAPPRRADVKVALQELLRSNGFECQQDMEMSVVSLKSISPPLSSSPEIGCLSSALDSTSITSKASDVVVSSAPEKKEYPIDPSLDIKNTIYASDEFRMFSFKVRPCSRAYSHDWTECPFVHPGENARRRDPRKYHYSCVPCPDFRKGACRRGDMCEYAHGVFECWLHPAQYKTRLCKDGTYCGRRVCFFAHTTEELRPLYLSTGSAVPSPRSATSAATPMDMAMALSLLPGSPSAASVMPPSPFTPPISPSGNGISHSSMAWSQQNIPTLHLPVSNFQTSRLRLSLNARDLAPGDPNMLQQDFEVQQQQLRNDFSGFSPPQFISSPANLSIRSNSLTPSNLDQLFSAEVSPRYSDQVAASSFFSPSRRSVILNQLQQQQNMLSPINTNVFSPNNVDYPLFHGSFGVPSPSLMSPRSIEPVSPMSSRLATFAHREKQQQQFRSLSSRDLGSNLPRDLLHNSAGIVGSVVNSWPKWESSNGQVDWSVQGEELVRFPKSSSIGLNGNETDVPRVQSMMKETPPVIRERPIRERPTVSVSGVPLSGEESNSSSQLESIDHAVLGAWIEQMQLDQIVA